MPDYPRFLITFQRRFPDEHACAEYLVALRWPEGFRCPGCGHDRRWALETKVWTFECAKQTSLTSAAVHAWRQVGAAA